MEIILFFILLALCLALYFGLGLGIYTIIDDYDLFLSDPDDYFATIVVFWPLILVVIVAKASIKLYSLIINELKI